jgi:glycosyltransferase involved in cell wall biosynthesis
MRILVVATHIKVPDAHGGSTHVAELVRNLRGHGPTLLLARNGSFGPDVLGVCFYAKHPPLGLKHALAASYFPKSYRAAKAFKPDVIYERGSSNGLGMMLSKALGIPMLTMVLDEHFSPLSLGHAKRIIATNLELIPAPHRDKGVKVSWGANTDHFRADLDPAPARARFGFADSDTVVGYTGSFQDWHGLRYLVEAAEALRERDVRYLLIGDGRRKEAIEALVADRGLGDRFVFTGRVEYDDVPGLLSAADCCVAPFDPDCHPLSAREGFALDPLKIFEYLAMAKPTITIESENIAALFEDPTHLTMVPRRDPTALATAIVAVAADPQGSREAAERGHARVVANHTWASHAAHLNSVFEEMLLEDKGEG